MIEELNYEIVELISLRSAKEHELEETKLKLIN